MPILTLNIESRKLFVQCAIGVSHPRLQLLKSKGLQVPTPLVFRALVDTGASCTCVDDSLLTTLGLTPTGCQEIHTPSTAGTGHKCDLYDVAFGVSFGSHTHVIGAMPVVVCDFKAQGIHALLGMDVLLQLHFFPNGPHGFFTIGV